jgi:hypothetical protein
MTKDSPELINEILKKSVPTNFHEYLINMSGVGYLMQALYNTPIPARLQGLERNIENSNKAIQFLENTNDPQYELIKRFFHTKYGMYRIISFWFEFHNTSITLKEPLELLFKQFISIIKKPDISKQERFLAEYSAYLLASTLADVNDYDLVYMKELLLVADSKNYLLISLVDSNFNQHFKQLSKEDKRRKEIRKFKTRLDLIDKSKIDNNVNIRLIDGQIIRKKPKR